MPKHPNTTTLLQDIQEQNPLILHSSGRDVITAARVCKEQVMIDGRLFPLARGLRAARLAVPKNWMLVRQGHDKLPENPAVASWVSGVVPDQYSLWIFYFIL